MRNGHFPTIKSSPKLESTQSLEAMVNFFLRTSLCTDLPSSYISRMSRYDEIRAGDPLFLKGRKSHHLSIAGGLDSNNSLNNKRIN